MGGKRVVTGVRNTVTVTEIAGSEVMTAAAHGVTMERVREAMSAHCMATPPMPHTGQATMAAATAMATSVAAAMATCAATAMATATATTAMATSAATATGMGQF